MAYRSDFWKRQFDRVDARITAGEALGAVQQLTGLLDAAQAEAETPARLRRLLDRHPLCTSLGSDAAKAAAKRIDPFCAAANRIDLARSEIEQALRRGQRCLLIGGPGDEVLSSLKGRDLPNLAVIDPQRVLSGGDGLAGRVAGGVDLVLAPTLLDALAPERLGDFMAGAAAIITPGGRLVCAAFTPGHAGFGWRSVFQPGQAFCHEAADLNAAARAAKLCARLFDDATGSLIWAEMRFGARNELSGGEP